MSSRTRQLNAFAVLLLVADQQPCSSAGNNLSRVTALCLGSFLLHRNTAHCSNLASANCGSEIAFRFDTVTTGVESKCAIFVIHIHVFFQLSQISSQNVKINLAAACSTTGACTWPYGVSLCTKLSMQLQWLKEKALIFAAWSWLLFEKLIVTQLIKKHPVFYGNRMFITVYTEAPTGSYPEPAESSSPHRSLSP